MKLGHFFVIRRSLAPAAVERELSESLERPIVARGKRKLIKSKKCIKR
jgi:hypothetical protein